jgi:tetratricopeptide (TPR) repeat protein
MKIRHLLFILPIITLTLSAKAQNSNSSEFYSLLELNDSYYKSGMSDSMFGISQELIRESTSLKNDSFLAVSYRIFGNYYFLKSNYTKAIEKYLEGIKIAEKNSNIYHILPQLYNNIGFNYNMLNYYDLSMKYLKKGEVIARQKMNNRSLAYIYENISLLYLSIDMPDSSLFYLKQSENSNYEYGKEKTFKAKDSNYIRAAIYTDYAKTYGEIYFRDSSVRYLNRAKNYFKIAMQFSDTTKDYKHLANSLYEYGHFFYRLNLYDSCEKYSMKSLKISRDFKYIDLLIKNADLLQKKFKTENNQSQAYRYLSLKDSCTEILSATNQHNQILDLAFSEKLRENEIGEKQMEAKKQRHRNIEFLLIAMGIVTFIILFLMLSRTFIVNRSFIRFFGQIGLLMSFEFINLLIHPTIEEVTSHNSFLMLVILVLIAALLIPIHHMLEKYVRVQLVEKNRKIKEANARKVLKQESQNAKPKNDPY